MIGTEAGLSVQTAAINESAMVRFSDQRPADRLPTISFHCPLSVSIDQHDKAPLILEAYIYLLGVQSLVSLSDGFAGYTFSALVVQK
jgi:hypothetical protein